MANPYPAILSTSHPETRDVGSITFTDPANQPGGGGGGTVDSVTAGDASITIGGTLPDPTVTVASLGVTTAKIAADAVTQTKIASGAVGVAQMTSGAATNGQLATADGAGNVAYHDPASIASVAAADTSIVVAGTPTAPTIATGTLDVIATNHAPAANWSNNSKKITSLANGASAQDAAAFGQIPTALPPNGTAGGDLSGTYPNPTVANVHGVIVSGTAPSANQVLTASDATHAAWATPATGAFSGCRASNSGTISVPDGGATFTPITCNTEAYDTASYHSTVSNTSRLTAPITGYYIFGGAISYASNSTGSRFAMLRLNGTTTVAIMCIPAVSGFETPIAISAELNLSATDYVELLAYQNSGGALNISVTNFTPNVWISYLGS